ncbi:hypothetical protein C8Q79DRAFT_902411 [Trametes meyenii]|nr:hypothetical protein C8Q79DRAFT_902411 [Trametes meyenii]
MSRSPSPVSDAASPAVQAVAHSEQSPHTEVPVPAHGASGASLEDREAARGDDDAFEPAARAQVASSSVSAIDPPSPAALAASASPNASSQNASFSTGTWQAVWSPAHNAYYFYNSATHETTWANPLQDSNAEAGPSTTSADSATSPPSTTAASSSTVDLYAAAAAQGIDPALAFLDPSLAAGPSNPAAFTYTAKFNARTGAFARPDSRDPTHLSEFERAKRMSEFYFDVNAWEGEVEMRKLQEAQEEEEGKKRKRPTKKDLERFKEQKRQKKLAKTAWLRS